MSVTSSANIGEGGLELTIDALFRLTDLPSLTMAAGLREVAFPTHGLLEARIAR
jgi:hypothetical protein